MNRIALAFQREVITAGVRLALLGLDSRAEFSETTSGEGLKTIVRERRPHLIVLDTQLEDGVTFDTVTQIRVHQPTIDFVFFTDDLSSDSVLGAIAAGAAGLVWQGSCLSTLAAAVTECLCGNSYVDPRTATHVFREIRLGYESLIDRRLRRLSRQEKKVASCLRHGMTNKAIASELTLSEKTIKNHVSQILQKLEVPSRTEAALFLSKQATIYLDEEGVRS